MSLFESWKGEEGTLSKTPCSQLTGGGVVQGAAAVSTGEASCTSAITLHGCTFAAVHTHTLYTWPAQHVHITVVACGQD